MGGTAVKWLATLGKVLAALVLIAGIGFLAPRFLHDGPVGPIPGGPLKKGERFDLPVSDWSFATDVAEIELQLASQRVSRTTWILVRDGGAYVPCSLGFPPGKSWHRAAQVDGRATLRIDGRRYPVTLTRDDDPSLPEFARAEVTRKYGSAPPSDAGVLFFRLSSRAATDGE
jgi:hypothetical protein